MPIANMKLYKLYTHQKSFSGKWNIFLFKSKNLIFVYYFSAEDLIINPKEHPDAKNGDVVEIYHPEDEGTRLLLQITGFNEDLKGSKCWIFLFIEIRILSEKIFSKLQNLRRSILLNHQTLISFYKNINISEIISIESNIAAAFNLRTYSEVVMQVVDPTAVALDSVEITFKDQYMGRSEMWRLKTFLVIIF